MKVLSLSLSLLAVGLAFLARKWALQSTVAFLLRNLGLDPRLNREYQHDFGGRGYGLYNFSDRSWPQIERRALSSMTPDEFKEKYVKGRRAVILTDFQPAQSWMPEDLLSRCADMPVSFKRRYSAGLRAIPGWLRRVFLDGRLQKTYNQSTDGVLRAMHTGKTLGEYLHSVKKDADLISVAKKVSTNSRNRLYSEDIVDYLFPVMLSAQHIEESHCQKLILEAKVALERLIRFAAAGRAGAPQFASMSSVLFVAPAGSRAIPLHQHGPFNDNLLWMLHGTKRIVTVSPSSTQYLYERPEFGGSEYADRVFSADVLEPDAGAQPDVRHVRAMEGLVSAGELIYLPVNVPHAVETTDADESVMLAWQMPVPGIARMFFLKSCSFLEELADFPPWAKNCEKLATLMQDNPEAAD